MDSMAGTGREARPPWRATTIKALRQHLGLTQQEMSALLGARQQTISEWETGVYAPRGTSSTLLNLIAERAAFTYRTGSEEQGARSGDEGG